MSGHAGTGGLQRHSIGDDYPYAVIGTVVNGVTKYYVMNLETGERYQDSYFSCGFAHLQVQVFKEFDNAAKFSRST